MAKQRRISDSFRSDSRIENLDPLEKYLYLYLLTNEHVSLCGLYEIQPRRIAFETGIDQDMVKKMIGRFEKDNKLVYDDGLVFMINFVKNQNVSKKDDNLWKGIEREWGNIGKDKKDRIKAKISQNKEAIKVLEGAYKDLDIPYLTLLNFTYTLLNLSEEGSSKKTSQTNKQIKEKESFIFPEEFSEKEKDLFNEYVLMRKKIKKTATIRSQELLIKKLQELGKTETERIAIIEQAIMGSRQSFYPIKNTNVYGGKEKLQGRVSTEGYADETVY